LRLAKDPHVSVKAGDMAIGTTFNAAPPNYNLVSIQHVVNGYAQDASGVATGKLEGNIAYVAISGWSDQQADAFDKLFDQFKESAGLILDVRMNGGGDEIAARRVAGRFVTQDTVYSKDRIRENGAWSGPFDRVVKPRVDVPHFSNPVAVLIGPKCLSSNESFILMMKHGANATLVGDATRGSSGRPVPHDLGNGVTVLLPSWEDQLPDGSIFEGAGIKPDVVVKVTASELAQRDPVIHAALKRLRQK